MQVVPTAPAGFPAGHQARGGRPSTGSWPKGRGVEPVKFDLVAADETKFDAVLAGAGIEVVKIPAAVPATD